MENVKFDTTSKPGKLLIEVDLAHKGGKSSTGKTTRVASTEGNVPIPGLDPNLKVGLNIFTK